MARPRGYIDIDALQAETTLDEAAAKCGRALDVKGTGPEVRIDCPFHCAGDHAGRKEIAINTDNPQKVFQCHSYQCQFRGNLLTLMHGWLTGRKPQGDKLKGDEFQRVKTVLAANSNEPARPALPKIPAASATTSPSANAALADSTEERVRDLATIQYLFSGSRVGSGLGAGRNNGGSN